MLFSVILTNLGDKYKINKYLWMYEIMINELKVSYMLVIVQIILLIGTRSLKYQQMMLDLRVQ